MISRCPRQACGDHRLHGIDFLSFSDNEASVREDVERIRQHALIPDGIPVSGYIYDVKTGSLQEVVGAGS